MYEIRKGAATAPRFGYIGCVDTTEIIFTVSEAPEGGYEARALGYSIFTFGATIEELKSMVQDAVRCHFDDAERPSVIRLADRYSVRPY